MTTKRKCGQCGKQITIDRQNLNGIVLFKNKYYHENCFVDLVQGKLTSGRNLSKWQQILDDTSSFKEEAKKSLEFTLARDELNEHLLKNYDITVVPKRFWTAVSDLGNGEYRGQRCKPVEIDTLVGCWKWGQVKLNQIATNNKAKHTGPSNDEQRLFYDFAILVSKVPSYLSYKEKVKVLEDEMKRYAYDNEVDMKKIAQAKQENKKDISDIFDDLYIE